MVPWSVGLALPLRPPRRQEAQIRPGKMALEMPRARHILAAMGVSSYSDIKDSLRQLYLEDARPWLVGFSGGKDSTMLASLIVEVGAGINDDQRKKPIAILCTDTRVEIPAPVEMAEGTLARFQRYEQHNESGHGCRLWDEVLDLATGDLAEHVETGPKLLLRMN